MTSNLLWDSLPSAPWSAGSTRSSDWTLHQIAPYLGRIKTGIARTLIEELTNPGDLIVDPFCGSAVIPLEAAALGRNVEAGDLNPYAVVLASAKLFPPSSLDEALENLAEIWHQSLDLRRRQDLRKVPKWIRAFFHPETLRGALAFRDACVAKNDMFQLANLLGILHHQRPGFLSFPSSNLVPYLRDRTFPRSQFPGLYQEREILPRMSAKLMRVFKRVPSNMASHIRLRTVDARLFPKLSDVKAVITSPPYMNGLDYIRDNRLRLWFVQRSLPEGLELGRRDRAANFAELLEEFVRHFLGMLCPGGALALVLGDVRRGGTPKNTAEIAAEVIRLNFADDLVLEQLYADEIPSSRRARRECRGSTKEFVLVYRRVDRRYVNG